MASAKLFLGEGHDSNRPPCFTRDHYDFWKIRMTTYLEAQGEEIWDAVKNGPYILTTIVDGVTGVKPQTSWDDDDRKKCYLTKRRRTFFNPLLGWMSFSEFLNAKQLKKYGTLWKQHMKKMKNVQT